MSLLTLSLVVVLKFSLTISISILILFALLMFPSQANCFCYVNQWYMRLNNSSVIIMKTMVRIT